MLLFVYTTTYKRFVIFTCRYLKWSWNITALSQSNCRNFSCSSIIDVICIGNSMNCSDISKLLYCQNYIVKIICDISKLLYVISWDFRRVKYETILKDTRVVFMANITYKLCYYLFLLLPAKSFVIFTCRYFKLSWNTTALSQSNCKNFLCSSIKLITEVRIFLRWPVRDIAIFFFS